MTRVALLLPIALAAASALAGSSDPLLPTGVAAKITVDVTQDGRSLYVRIANPTRHVFTSATVSCITSAAWVAVFQGKRHLEANAFLTREVIKTVLPEKEVEVYLEAPTAEQVTSCRLEDVRGRERRWFELF